MAVDKHAKTVIGRSTAILSKILTSVFDLRRQTTLLEESGVAINRLDQVESAINDVALRMVYKLNDAAFRPICAQWVEWASSELPKKDTSGRNLRRQSVYSFLGLFFDKLGSVVTNYSIFVMDDAAKVLKEADVTKGAMERAVWKQVLKTLAHCFQHDKDDFWQSPAHFTAIAPALVEQFLHASVLSLSEDLIPAVVELAVAADSQEHQKELNTALLKHLRSENAAVRLAAVRAEQELAQRLGEEWLGMLPEMLPYISELQEDDDEVVERETMRWIVMIESVLGESLDSMLQ
jgi:U3 small nucleolar RNA-associated protein 10